MTTVFCFISKPTPIEAEQNSNNETFRVFKISKSDRSEQILNAIFSNCHDSNFKVMAIQVSDLC